jgi:hypothetical protein
MGAVLDEEFPCTAQKKNPHFKSGDSFFFKQSGDEPET